MEQEFEVRVGNVVISMLAVEQDPDAILRVEKRIREYIRKRLQVGDR